MASPQLPAVDMRHTKLKPEEAALIAGEVVKPSWASRNEGIHERISFEDTLWGFEMAGGAFYKTPLRIAYVKPGSRAEQACIRMGDTVLRIQGIDTSTLTLQEAHQLVQEAGINLKIAVTSPDDDHDAHYEYEDPLMRDGGLTAEQLKALERERIQKAIAKAIRCRDLEWPWVRRKFIIYRESNCFMVPSKYENKHRDQFPELPAQKIAYFFPTEKLDKVEPKSKQNKAEPEVNNQVEENGIDDGEEEEEEVEEEEVSEEAGLDENEDEEQDQQEDSTERLLENNLQDENSSEQKENLDNTENNTENELGEENAEETLESIRKDSEGSSNYELDTNNNHVSKNKNLEQSIESNAENTENTSEIIENNSEIIENNQENTEDSSDYADNNSEIDEIINEISENDNDLVNTNEIPKTDDEILDSVLNSNEDTQNER